MVNMINTVYEAVSTIINKENNGYVSPEEFNLIAHNEQGKIFRGYFEDENRDKTKNNKGYANKGYSNLPFNQRQRIDQFSKTALISKTDGIFELPNDLYLIEDDGVRNPANGSVIEEIERSRINYLLRSESKPTAYYPIYERFSDSIRVLPSTIELIEMRYLREPKAPKWTYRVIPLPSGEEKVMFDPTRGDYQDFELHPSEYYNLVINILTPFGVNLRDMDVVQATEIIKKNLRIRDEE